MAKAIGERWKALTAEQKAQYEVLAKAQSEAWKAWVSTNPEAAAAMSSSKSKDSGGKGRGPAANEDAGDGSDDGGMDTATQLPPSRIKKIAKLDETCGNLGKDAAYALTLATELFLEALGEEALAVATVGSLPQRMREHVVASWPGVAECRGCVSPPCTIRPLTFCPPLVPPPAHSLCRRIGAKA